MRILFVSHYFFPEGNAPATRVYELTRRWVRAGHQVTVLTGVPSVPDGVVYEGYRNRWFQREDMDGVEVLRVWTYLAPNKGIRRRTANYLSLMLSATLAGLLVRRPDLVVATSPQFFCGWAGVLVSRLRRRPLVLEIRDLWPASILAVGALKGARLIRFLEFLERRMYAAARLLVTVGEGYKAELEARGVPSRKITVIPNGVDLECFAPREDDGVLRREYDLGDRFVCAYVGTVGMGSGLEVTLRAARLLEEQGRDDVRFLLVGDGAVRAELEAQVRAQGLRSVVLTGRLPKSRMPEVLAAADACLVHLTRTELFQTVLPSKIFEAAAMRRPIVLGVQGFAAELVSRAEAGLCIEPENEAELVEAVTKLAQDPSLCASLGRNGQEQIARRFEYGALAREYEAKLAALLAGEPAS